MGNVLQKKKPLKEVMRENKRTINRAIRELDREKMNLEKNEKKIIADIKKAAKANQMGAVKVHTHPQRLNYILHSFEPASRNFCSAAAYPLPLLMTRLRDCRSWLRTLYGRGATSPSS